MQFWASTQAADAEAPPGEATLLQTTADIIANNRWYTTMHLTQVVEQGRVGKLVWLRTDWMDAFRFRCARLIGWTKGFPFLLRSFGWCNMESDWRLVGFASRGIMSYSTGWWGGSSSWSGGWRRCECKVAESNYRTSVSNQLPTSSNSIQRTSSDFITFCLWLQNIAFGLECQNNHQSLLSWLRWRS